MKFEGLCGPTAQHHSLNVNAELTINWYLERTRSGQPKGDPILMRTPGLAPYVVFEQGPVRQLYAHNGRMFAVAYDTLYEILGENNYVSRGTVSVSDEEEPAFMVSNGVGGSQLMVASNDLGYIFDLDTNTLTQITDGEFPTSVNALDFVDGYFVVLNSDNNSIHLSDLYDGFSWNGTMVAQRSMAADEVGGIIVAHRNIWWFGQRRTEVWYNSGDTFPFQPILSAGVIEQGLAAPYSVARIDNSVFWLGMDERGGVVAYRAEGFVPKRISTHAVEEAWRNYPNPRDVIAWTYTEAGHSFWVLYFLEGPAEDSAFAYTHWVYDASLPPEEGWHQRATWNPSTCLFEPHAGRCHAYERLEDEDVHLVGDRATGAVYRQSLDLLDEQLVVEA